MTARLPLYLVLGALTSGCGAAAPAASGDKPVVTASQLRWNVEQLPASEASRNCPVLVLRAEEGPDARAELRLRDECEGDPDYKCEESGAGCSTADYEHVGFVDLAGRRFAWVRHRAEWHDNGSVELHLYGLVCGRVGKVWSYSWISPAEETKLTKLAPITDGDWKALEATLSDADGTRTRRLEWSAKDCRFAEKR